MAKSLSLCAALHADGFGDLGRIISEMFAGGAAPATHDAPQIQPRSEGAATASADRTTVGCVMGPLVGREQSRPAVIHSAPAETFDLRHVAADLREGTRDYLLCHDLTWIEPCAVCDADMVRVPCSDCDETGFVRGPGGRYDIRTCDTCAGSGWRMRCTGCLSFDSGAL